MGGHNYIDADPVEVRVPTPTKYVCGRYYGLDPTEISLKLECRLLPNVMAALPNTGGAFCSTPQSLADADY